MIAPVPINHDDVIKWKHFPRYWPFVRGIHRSPVNSPHKGQWRGVLMFSLICAWINAWVNNREAGDLRRHHTHCDVFVMKKSPYTRTQQTHQNTKTGRNYRGLLYVFPIRKWSQMAWLYDRLLAYQLQMMTARVICFMMQIWGRLPLQYIWSKYELRGDVIWCLQIEAPTQ